MLMFCNSYVLWLLRFVQLRLITVTFSDVYVTWCYICSSTVNSKEENLCLDFVQEFVLWSETWSALKRELCKINHHKIIYIFLRSVHLYLGIFVSYFRYSVFGVRASSYETVYFRRGPWTPSWASMFCFLSSSTWSRDSGRCPIFCVFCLNEKITCRFTLRVT